MTTNPRIKDMAAKDRPRERLAADGAEALSNADFVARGKSALRRRAFSSRAVEHAAKADSRRANFARHARHDSGSPAGSVQAGHRRERLRGRAGAQPSERRPDAVGGGHQSDARPDSRRAFAQDRGPGPCHYRETNRGTREGFPVAAGAGVFLHLMIHPTAIVHPKAQLDPTVSVEPYALIDEHVIVGANCRIGPHAHLTGHTTIGANNSFHTGCVIGDAPQDLKYKGEPTRLRIGEGNVFREHVTLHRSNDEAEETV